MESRTGRFISWIALVAADALFVWMFLAVAPLEQQADHGATELRQFVADWRHGMAGNSPIYMPGFFALAAAGWYWVQRQSIPRLMVEAVLAMVLGFTLASVLAGRLFWGPGAVGAFTAFCWLNFVAASKRALMHRTFRPFMFVPLPYVALASMRPWTVDGLLAVWGNRLANGDLVAIGSAVAIPVLTAVFVGTARATKTIGNNGNERELRAF